MAGMHFHDDFALDREVQMARTYVEPGFDAAVVEDSMDTTLYSIRGDFSPYDGLNAQQSYGNPRCIR